ncbi:hypothetical protein JRQ81_019475, partial [Phrynocephalus forsythii]
YQFWQITSWALSTARIQGWRFGTHSFCIEVAPTAAAMGYTVEEIKVMGFE